MKKILALGVLALLASIPCSLRAGDPAITDIAKVDAAYAWIGEYTGSTSSGPIGVRISVRDGNKPMFAKLYAGGLPGLGWGTTEPTEFGGTLDEHGLELSASKSGQTIRSGASGVVLVDGSGAEVSLKKISRRSMMLGKAAPAGATVLFDGKPNSHWKSAKVTDDGLLGVGAETVEPLTGGHLHVEFRTPYMPKSSGQKRGNSGIYLQRRYEVQVLDSFALGGIENECGSIYRQRKPDLNMALPPLVWQTYDIFFEPARFSASGEKTAPTLLTVVHNGVPVHYRTVVVAKTGAGKEEGPDPLPLLLQDHSDPIFYRNIWFVPTHAVPTVQSNGSRLTSLLNDYSRGDSASLQLLK